MTPYRKVQAVEKVFRLLEKDVATFKQATTLKCKDSCGLCCLKPDIFASPLEFLPFAYDSYKKGHAMQLLETLKNESDRKICINLNSFMTPGSGGYCGSYQHRGMICRLFGFSAMIGKTGYPQLVTCKTIKTESPDSIALAEEHIQSRKYTPIISNYYQMLRSIDSRLGTEMLPINRAIEEAIEYVLAYYAYRHPFKAG